MIHIEWHIYSALYEGSNTLTFPCVHKDRDEVVEGSSPVRQPAKAAGKVGEGQDVHSKWGAAAKGKFTGACLCFHSRYKFE